MAGLEDYVSEESRNYYRRQNAMRDAEANGYERNEYGEYKRPGHPWSFTIDENGNRNWNTY